MDIIRFVKNWSLPIAMVLGVIIYFVYVNIPFLEPTKPFVLKLVGGFIQPALIFTMLFLTYCKVNVSELRPCKWHGWLLLIQGGAFLVLAGVIIVFPQIPARILIEGGMLCVICPTATAAAVVTRKLGGNAAHITSFTILINITAAFLVSLVVPVLHPRAGMDFGISFATILSKVFPLLLCPFIAAILLRHLWPKMHAKLGEYHDLSFYLWAIALTSAIAMTVRSIVHSDVSVWYQVGLAFVSLGTCIIQFVIGRKVGNVYDDQVSAGQALGQKNTVLAIWMGYTFFTPVTAVAAGFYSVWHNLFNSYQLYLQRRDIKNGHT